jgi:hypothetical protein
MSTETKKDVFYSDMLVRFSHCDPAGIIFYPHYFVMFNGLVGWVCPWSISNAISSPRPRSARSSR